ncbi:hypothetical protein [Bacteroides caecimuris]|uniref:Glycosyltransferase n=2 Tax=Bacteroides caecimuris TaxID=1796613 RepID=A0A4S2DI46_9BACE|nr:hypothetical protein [Bacteroides caecimuris]TGY40494.1 hypothetical protein E5353_02205 [Bacteroides caecimuris]
MNAVSVMQSSPSKFIVHGLLSTMELRLCSNAYNCSAGVTDIIMNNGVLIPTFRQEEYANRLVELMQNDNLRTELQKNSFASIQRFYPKNIIPQWIRQFERLPFSR